MGKDALQNAIRLAGGQLALAQQIGTSQSQISYWLTRSKRGVPAEFCAKIEAATGVERHALRPDLYPAESAA